MDDLKNATIIKKPNVINQDYSRNSKTLSVNSTSSDNENEVSLSFYLESCQKFMVRSD